jgi:hypothetical protein
MKHVIQRALTVLRAGEWMPMTATRVLIGIFLCISGGTKLFVPAQFGVLEQTMVQSHIPFPHANALFVSMGSNSRAGRAWLSGCSRRCAPQCSWET